MKKKKTEYIKSPYKEAGIKANVKTKKRKTKFYYEDEKQTIKRYYKRYKLRVKKKQREYMDILADNQNEKKEEK